MKVQFETAPVKKEIEFCIQCPFCVVVPDPDFDDWFCDDDEAVCCKHPDYPVEEQSEYYKTHHISKYPVIEGSNRPYETKKVSVPNHCPLAKQPVPVGQN